MPAHCPPRPGRAPARRGRIAAALLALGPAACAPAEAGPAARAAFLHRHHCAIVSRLEAIHRRGPVTTSRDRFIVVALRDAPQHYVQCIFRDRDAAMLCEAASGAYGDPAHAPALGPAAVTALHALGYRQEDPRENFSRALRLGDPPDLGIAADLMLSALHDAYGARDGTALEITAPHGGPGGTGCGTPAV